MNEKYKAASSIGIISDAPNGVAKNLIDKATFSKISVLGVPG